MPQTASDVTPNHLGSDPVTSGDLEAQNNASAWTSRRQRRSMNMNASDSKRNDAAHLAQQLATTTSWSETFLPQSYGTLPVTNTTVERDGQSQQDDLDPPPAYSKRPQAHEVPTTPIEAPSQSDPSSSNMNMPSPAQQYDSDDEVPADLQQDPSTRNPSNVEEPLLDRGQRRRRCRRSKKQRLRDWVHRGKDKKRKCVRLMVVLAVCSVFSIIVLCFIQATLNVGVDWFRKPNKSSQILVPTGPDYRHFDPTGDITGLYRLYDRLELKSATGTIDIEIDPQPGDGPAYLIVSSDVGRINVKVSPEYLSRRKRTHRPVFTEIRTFTGSISADILLGNGGLAFVDSALGTQVLEVLTYDVHSRGETSNITTESTTGAQKVNLRSIDGSSITDVRARHHVAATGSLDITYPSTWLGEVHVMSTVLGRAIAEGNNLDYTRQDNNEIFAHRGGADGRQPVEVISDGTGIASFRC